MFRIGIVIGVLGVMAVWAQPDSVLSDSLSDEAALVVADSQKNVVNLDKMVVTATRTKRRMSETPASVSVIDMSDIATSPARGVDELLTSRAGVHMKRVTGMGEGIPSHIMIRGIPGALSSTRTLVLVDGVPSNAAGTPFFFLGEVPLDAIRSVEIVRGPHSALYGANAFNGVINILTREGDGRPGASGFLETSLPFTVPYIYSLEDNHSHGSDFIRDCIDWSLWHVGAQSGGGNERVNYLVSGGLLGIGNYFVADSVLVEGPHGRYLRAVENNDYRATRVFGKVGVNINDNASLKLHTRFFKSNLGFGRTKKVIPDSVDVVIRGEKFLVGPTLEVRATEALDLNFGAFYRRVNGEFLNEGPLKAKPDTMVSSIWNTHSNDVQLEGKATLKAGDYQTLTVGFDNIVNNIELGVGLSRETGDTIFNMGGADTTVTNIGGYLQDEIRISHLLVAIPGVRVDYNTQFGTAVSPKLGLSSRPFEFVTLRGTVGKAFRAPTLTELYMDLMINPSFVVRSNPNLQPEHLWAADAGIEVRPIPSLRILATGFYNNMRDLVVQRVVIPGVPTEFVGQYWDDDVVVQRIRVTDNSSLATTTNIVADVTHANAVSAWSAGLEAEMQWQIKEWINLRANYVFLQSEDETFGVPLDYTPTHAGNLEVAWQKQLGRFRLEGSVTEELVGARSYLDWGTSYHQVEVFRGDILLEVKTINRDLPMYALTNMSLSLYPIPNLYFSFNAQNLFDERYEESGGTFAPGRLLTLKIGAEL